MSCFQNHHLKYYGKCQRKIGDGTYSHVHKYITPSKESVAVKVHTDTTATFREIALLEECKSNPYIIDLIDVGYDSRRQKFYHVMPLARGTIYDQLQEEFFVGKPQRVRRAIFQILQALAFLHTKNYIHRDMKVENILVFGEDDDQLDYKLCDFGLSRKVNVPGDSYTSYMVTLYYRPPENLLDQENYGKSIDIWSLGCIFVELILGNPPFESDESEIVLKKQIETLGNPLALKTYPEYMQNYMRTIPVKKFQMGTRWWDSNIKRKVIKKVGADAYDLIEKMLQLNPSARISVRNSLMHPYFSTFSPISIPLLSINIPYQPMDWRKALKSRLSWTERMIIALDYYTVACENGLSHSNIAKAYCFFNKFLNAVPPRHISLTTAAEYMHVIFSIVAKTDSCSTISLRTVPTRQNFKRMKKCRRHFLHILKFKLHMHTGYDWFWQSQNQYHQKLWTNEADNWEQLYDKARALYMITLFMSNIFLEFSPTDVAAACQTFVLMKYNFDVPTTATQNAIHSLIQSHLHRTCSFVCQNPKFKKYVIDIYK